MRLRNKVGKIKELWKNKEVGLHIDREFYKRINTDVCEAGVDPFVHYILHGYAEGRDPAPWFSTKGYIKQNPDVANSKLNPFYHYLKYGRREGRRVLPSNALASSNKSKYRDFFPSAVTDHVGALKQYLLSQHMSGRADVNENIFNTLDDLVAKGIEVLPIGDISLELHMAAIYPYFDKDFYLRHNPDVAAAGINPLVHYCKHGWSELRRPNPEFDSWWYCLQYLNVKADTIDPLLHYVLVGKSRDYKTRRPDPIQLRKASVRYQAGQRIKRVCLFAAYDQHGIVDDYVIEYLKDLSQYADIYYLADCDMQPGELSKLDGLVKGAWSIRHGEYDFGSYSRLARELVGWEVLDQYDELILANDSCYLLRPLKSVFQKMDSIETDWWGMQATKGLSITRAEDQKRFPNPIALEEIKSKHLNSFESDYIYNFHIGSYFVVYRKSVIQDKLFRAMLNSVVKQKSKSLIIRKYENGFTRQLIHQGYQFHTYIDELYPFHPIYTESIFELLGKGFPFLKRYLLAENHYFVPDLSDWKERIRSIVPEVKLDKIESNLYRVSNSEKLYRNFRVKRSSEYTPIYPHIRSNSEIASLDQKIPKFDNWWAFPVCAYDHTFAGNDRAVFEEVKSNTNIKKVILTRSKHINVSGENVEIWPLKSIEGQDLLLRSKIVFIKHTPEANIGYPLSGDHHHFINLWHGIPLKRIGYASLDQADNLERLAKEHSRSKAVISSSKVDTLAMASGFYPLSYHDIWMTGLPRHDFIVREFDRLPQDLQAEELRLRKSVGGRRLILFCPTFRNGQNGAGYKFSEAELSALADWLQQNNAVLGVREHMADRHQTYKNQLVGENILDVSSLTYPNIEILFRVSDALITDYSSCFVDYILTGKHLISFAYDLDRYQSLERGMFYDLDFCFPGDICKEFSAVIASLNNASSRNFQNTDPSFRWKKKLFFDYEGDRNAARVVSRVKALIGGY
ncbi:CDP-glycerol glycerophosphotransferase family protein [Falsochrobactrum ovis]|uniref:CDP-glycerol glycerophosphotransferase (TagB/SpsB family) n=1 Tax=Falsochrobactrum ovis TaxID=1293442 RepID=A0A364JWE2_9HYPH|nr:CDP-glycerol glycerophosphotransferase family protein [Falsochrobactrum ovis]RAK30960.1 CDP-glycerol glycerophosphotransferase (TagB/SpsB family) [Falsochrobactrum ovis]